MVRAEDFIPLPAATSRGSVQQGLSVAGGALGLFQLGLATDKRYSLANTGRPRANKMRILYYLATLALLTSCVSVPQAFSADSIPEAQRLEVIVLADLLTYAVPKEVDSDGIGGGLLPGRYVAEREDANGVFFRGAVRSQFKTGVAYLAAQRFALFNGGIWVPKTAGVAPRLYFYVESSYPSVATLSELRALAMGKSPDEKTSGAAPINRYEPLPLQRSANLIAGIAIQANVGKINFWPTIVDTSFSEALLRAHRLALQHAATTKP